jgi:hypothetical protein
MTLWQFYKFEAKQICISQWRTGLSGAQAGVPSELAALGKTQCSLAKIHRTVRCAPDCPVSPRATVFLANSRLPRDCYGFRTSESQRQSATVRSHRTVQCATGLSCAPQSAENPNGRLTWHAPDNEQCSVWCAPDCPVCPSTENSPNG